MQFHGAAVEMVQSFVHLGSELEANGKCNTNMRQRMAIAGGWWRDCKSISRQHNVSLYLELKLVNICLLSMMTY